MLWFSPHSASSPFLALAYPTSHLMLSSFFSPWACSRPPHLSPDGGQPVCFSCERQQGPEGKIPVRRRLLKRRMGGACRSRDLKGPLNIL
ncbi:hypothetical protein XENOCAPTIV_018458 [Xenoophorus captivus]|uniref:Secreted protein n=1 Tax=Xenoophorus captivus TaxID=1517983 RepID=A0ABV0S074_9TELE